MPSRVAIPRTMMGPRAKPIRPPVTNTLTDRLACASLSRPARAPMSGWHRPKSSPPAGMAAATPQKTGDQPKAVKAIEVPTIPTASHGIRGQRSTISAVSGWLTALVSDWIEMRIPAVARVNWNFSRRRGISGAKNVACESTTK